MQFRLLAVFVLLLMMSCSSYKNNDPRANITNLKYSKFVAKYEANSFSETDISTVKINAKATSKIGDSSQKLGLKFRISKGEKIWISGDYFGIPVVKMLIEKDSIHYYNKFDKTYYDGSFKFIEQLIGFKISYASLEKLLVGDLILQTNKSDYSLDVTDNSYLLEERGNKFYFAKATIYPLIFRLKSQVIGKNEDSSFYDKYIRAKDKKKVKIKNLFATYYNEYQDIDGFMFPKELTIKGKNQGKESVITIKYNDVKFNEELKFPYKIPKECDKKITLNSKKRKKKEEPKEESNE